MELYFAEQEASCVYIQCFADCMEDLANNMVVFANYMVVFAKNMEAFALTWLAYFLKVELNKIIWKLDFRFWVTTHEFLPQCPLGIHKETQGFIVYKCTDLSIFLENFVFLVFPCFLVLKPPKL